MMAYDSVDKLQNVLSSKIFHYAKDKKKAAGRALGTMVEIIAYYLLKTWGFNNSTSIEKGLVEYGNVEISHNVEYSLHPIINEYEIVVPVDGKSITSSRILKILSQKIDISKFEKRNNNLLDTHNILRNACTVGESKESFLLVSIKKMGKQQHELLIYEQLHHPYAMFECKRVGVEEGIKKGPQTIEKAKQGAYVARAASSLQKIRTDKGEKYGLIYKADNIPYIKPYIELMEEIIYTDNSQLLTKFILTVGVVSNHGNWFTAENQNKELKVLAQSYDWLIFLTDRGLAKFIEDLLLKPEYENRKIQEAFKSSYIENKKQNSFTKVKMNIEADVALIKYFAKNIKNIEGWFNIITPQRKTIENLKKELMELRSKNWRGII